MKLNFTMNIWKKVQNLWPKTGKERISLLRNIIFQVVYYAFVLGLMGYLIYSLQHEPGDNVAFQMATISGLLGGLVLSGGLIKGKSPPGTELRRVGVLFIASTLGFILFGLYAPLVDVLPKDKWFFKFFEFAFLAGFVIGVIGFALATAYLALLIPKLWKEDHTES